MLKKKICCKTNLQRFYFLLYMSHDELFLALTDHWRCLMCLYFFFLFSFLFSLFVFSVSSFSFFYQNFFFMLLLLWFSFLYFCFLTLFLNLYFFHLFLLLWSFFFFSFILLLPLQSRSYFNFSFIWLKTSFLPPPIIVPSSYVAYTTILIQVLYLGRILKLFLNVWLNNFLRLILTVLKLLSLLFLWLLRKCIKKTTLIYFYYKTWKWIV